MHCWKFAPFLLLALSATCSTAAAPALPTPLVATLNLGDGPVTLRSRPQDAGAISSLVYRGKEFIASRENGWLLQGAGGYGLWAECLNPTLAGARYDPPGTTSSRLLATQADRHIYSTLTQMAFWTPPGRRCSDAGGQRRHAVNTTALSDTFYAQTMTAGFRGVARAIEDQVVITTPRPEPIASFEVLTGYMPPGFDRFYAFDLDSRTLKPLAGKDLTTERFEPLVVSTRDGRSAIGVLAITPSENAHYAAFRNAEVSKWSLVYHFNVGLAAGPHHFSCVVMIGTRDEVAQALRSLSPRFDPPWITMLLWGLVGAGVFGIILGLRRRQESSPLQPLS